MFAVFGANFHTRPLGISLPLSFPGDYPVCSPIQTYCIDAEKEEFLASDYLRKECSCPEGCSRVYYEHGVSSAGVSTRVKSYLNQIYNVTAEDVDKDYAMLDIYLSDLRYEEMSVRNTLRSNKTLSPTSHMFLSLKLNTIKRVYCYVFEW